MRESLPLVQNTNHLLCVVEGERKLVGYQHATEQRDREIAAYLDRAITSRGDGAAMLDG